MKPLIVYCSQPSPQMKTFLLALGLAQNAIIRPLTALPQPDALRIPALLVERRELLDAIEDTQTHLALFASGELAPDAGKEYGLSYKRNALQTRLRAVQAMLSSVTIGGEDNG